MAEDWSRPVVHWEIQAKDVDLISRFYGELFNWSVADGPIKAFSAGVGAPEPITGHAREAETSRIVLYIQVLKLEDTIAKAQTLGGKLIRAPFDPGGRPPTLAWIDDPEGNRIVLVQQ